MAIDTLAYVKALEAAGVERKTAEAQVEALSRHILPDLATKSDIQGLKSEIDGVKSDLRALETKVTVLMWAVGANVALTIAILGVLLRASGHG